MARALIVLTLLVGCTPVPAMTRRDWVAQGALATVSVVDALQTRHIVAAGAEENPLVGDHGQRMPFPVAGLLVLTIELVVAAQLPPAYRSGFEGFSLGAETYCVTSNFLDGWYPW